MQKILISFAIFFHCFGIDSALAAELKEFKPYRLIVLEGEIVSGDYERFLSFILDKGTTYQTVYLASRGGDALEAVKMGRLIRALNYKTEIPRLSNEGNLCYKIVNKANCGCASACPLIFLGGVYREGNALDVHRIYFSHEYLKSMSLAQAKAISERLELEVNQYLKEMGAPNSMAELIGASASDSLISLSPSYVSSYLSGWIKGYDELVIAKCGSQKILFEKEMSGEISSKDVSESFKCKERLLTAEIQKNYKSVIEMAMRFASPEKIPNGSTLELLRNKKIRDLTDLLGMPATEAIRLLALFGIGDDYKDKGFIFKDMAYKFLNSIRINVDEQGKIFNISVFFFEGETSSAYNGIFLDGLNPESTPQNFVEKMGEPIDNFCYRTGVCGLRFNLPEYSLEVLFEKDMNTLRAINIDSPGRWKKR